MTRNIRKPILASKTPAKNTGEGSGLELTTPLSIRSNGVKISKPFELQIRKRLASELGKFSDRIVRVTLRFEDTNGPRGGIDRACRAKAVLIGLPSVVLGAQSATEQVAFAEVVQSLGRAVRKTLQRAGRSRRVPVRGHGVPRSKSQGSTTQGRASDPGSLIGRRVGRGRDRLKAVLERPEKQRRDAYVDTAAPGVSATDRRAGGGSTARRNSLGKASRATATLEDSQQERPSRKSTRRSANRAKSATNLQKKAVARASSPQTRASQARANRRRASRS